MLPWQEWKDKGKPCSFDEQKENSRKPRLPYSDIVLFNFFLVQICLQICSNNFANQLQLFCKSFATSLQICCNNFANQFATILQIFYNNFANLLQWFCKTFAIILKIFCNDFENIWQWFWKYFANLLKSVWQSVTSEAFWMLGVFCKFFLFSILQQRS